MKEYIAYCGTAFQIEWYFDNKDNSQALEYFNTLAEDQQDKMLYLIKRMGDAGRISDITKFRNEGGGIYAFKPQPDRYLCFFQKGKKIIITNAFRKKTDRLPAAEKKKALLGRTDYLHRVNKGNYYEEK